MCVCVSLCTRVLGELKTSMPILSQAKTRPRFPELIILVEPQVIART